MSYCIYKVNSTGEYGYDVDAKFPQDRRDGYTILECGLKTKADADARIREREAEDAAQKK